MDCVSIFSRSHEEEEEEEFKLDKLVQSFLSSSDEKPKELEILTITCGLTDLTMWQRLKNLGIMEITAASGTTEYSSIQDKEDTFLLRRTISDKSGTKLRFLFLVTAAGSGYDYDYKSVSWGHNAREQRMERLRVGQAGRFGGPGGKFPLINKRLMLLLKSLQSIIVACWHQFFSSFIVL